MVEESEVQDCFLGGELMGLAPPRRVRMSFMPATRQFCKKSAMVRHLSRVSCLSVVDASSGVVEAMEFLRSGGGGHLKILDRGNN